MTHPLERIHNDLKDYGLLPTFKDVFLRSVNRVMFMKVLRCLKVEAVQPELLDPPKGYRGVVLGYPELRKYFDASEYELPRSFVEQACEKGDRCYGLFRGDTLGAYQWYSTRTTDTGWHALAVGFADQYVYMYKAFTHPDHRGRRLYPVGVTTMLVDYLECGYKGIVAVTETNNFAALNSCHRMGFRDCGTVFAAILLNHYFLHADAESQACGFRLTRTDRPLNII